MFSLMYPVQIIDSTPRLLVDHRLDALSSTVFVETVAPLLGKFRFLIVDFSACQYLSSNGIRSLLVAAKKLNAKNGKLFLTHVPDAIYEVLEMAGLHQVFHIYDDDDSVFAEIKILNPECCPEKSIVSDSLEAKFISMPDPDNHAYIWDTSNEIAGYNELGISVGTGSIAGLHDQEGQQKQVFITTGYSAGFVHPANEMLSDFRIARTPEQNGIFISSAMSFGANPSYRCDIDGKKGINTHELVAELLISSSNNYLANNPIGMVLCGYWGPQAFISVIMARSTEGHPSESVIRVFEDVAANGPIAGATYSLNRLYQHNGTSTLIDFLKENITLENCTGIQKIGLEKHISKATAWIFTPTQLKQASEKRIVIDIENGIALLPHESFLCRRLYRDSSRIELKKLHGGFSAQTFQVTSFDFAGRKLRPTVLKIADKAMITREAERCQKYALPYILNNSAMILGTEYHGHTGALRYNFVGIDGEQTRLKWLTNYFETMPLEELEPLFDRIFMQILKPWYGQPVQQIIFPFRDHDPTRTFFPNIFEEAKKQLGLSSEKQSVEIAGAEHELLNPYWFLKHYFNQHKTYSVDYFSTICHGDLNMQNILLDDKMNVYLIDFSETRPRSVVSDFARIEAIMMVEFLPMETEDDYRNNVQTIISLYQEKPFLFEMDDFPECSGAIKKCLGLTLKMRGYAIGCAQNNPGTLPYYMALLEWVLPVVCYRSANILQKKLSMVLAACISDQVRKAMI